MIPVWDWAWDEGIQSNLIASAIAASVAGVVTYVQVWRKHVVPHLRRTEEIHRHLDPNDPWHIGD